MAAMFPTNGRYRSICLPAGGDHMSDRQLPMIPMLPRSEWTDAARDVFAFWEGPEARENGSRSNTMMTLAQHPQLAMHVLELGKYMLVGSTLSPRHREMVVLRVAARYRVDYEWAHHVHSARLVGMTDNEFIALQTGGASSLWSNTDQAVIDAIDQLCSNGRIDPGTQAILSDDMDWTCNGFAPVT
ncbi:carboxymuconolactone decarboxylase family protein [Sphingobium terrigena]|uniref:Carboxymuconolactone decarboxylase family protein n=1 Tax=Sphingobium terrigena TaxID=2304063 RepID=A0A418YPM9_9SPHN|nr:carboxymuconolactone decarboxylase family protein [Sphingobium terrigena]RJG53299.1 carboxymuconolactone decarboxylase family protein [Sphingobium terrigena]